MQLVSPNQNPNEAEALEPEAAVDHNIEDIRQLIMGMGLSHENVVQLTSALNNLTAALNMEREERQGQIDQNKANIDQNKADILQLQQDQAEEAAKKEQLERQLDEGKAERQALENKMDELQSQLRQLIALSSQM